MTEQQPQEEASVANTSQQKAKAEWWRFFIPTKNLFITPLLIDINIVLFIAMVISGGDFESFITPKAELLIQWGANYKAQTLNGEWWRLFTSIFEHIGIIHLAMNMYAFLFVGVLLEPRLGKAQFIAAYLVTGVMGGIASLWWHDEVLGAGASGAIFGMYGVFLALLTTNFIEKSQRKPLLTSIGIFVVYNLVYGMRSGIDNAAHVGGLLSGLVIGYIYFLASRSKQVQHKWIGVAVVLVAGTITAFVTLPKIKDPLGEFQNTMNKISGYEHEALQYYNLPENTTVDKKISFLNDTSLPAWDHAFNEILHLENIQLPKELAKRRELILTYITLRQGVARLTVSKLKENTTTYDDEINKDEKDINDLISQIENLSK